MDGNSHPYCGESPCSGMLTADLPDGHTDVVVAVIVGLMLCDGPFGSAMQHTLFGSVCGPEDGKLAGSMFSRGPGGAQDQREEIRLGMTKQ